MKATQKGWQQERSEWVPETSSGGTMAQRGEKKMSKSLCMPCSKKTHSLSSQNLFFFNQILWSRSLKNMRLIFILNWLFQAFPYKAKEGRGQKKKKKGEDSTCNQNQQSNPGLTSDTGQQSWLTAGSLVGNSLEYKWETRIWSGWLKKTHVFNSSVINIPEDSPPFPFLSSNYEHFVISTF